VADVGREF
jgi:hypothetical protein